MIQRQVEFYGRAAIMQRLLKALIFSGLVVYFFYIMTEVRPSRISLATEPPAPVSLAEFSRQTDLHGRNEVNVIGRIDSRDGTPITRDDKTQHLFLFFAPESGPEDTVVRAAVLIKEEDLEAFRKELEASPDDGQVGLNGRVLQLPKLANTVEGIILDRGLRLGDQFAYITPFFGDRRDPLDNGPWYDLALIGVASLTVLYQLFMALRWYRNDRRVMAKLSDGQISVYRQSRGIFEGLGTSLFLMFLAAVGIAFVFSQLR